MNKIKFMIVLTILCMVQVQYYMQILDLKLEFMMKSPMPNEPIITFFDKYHKKKVKNKSIIKSQVMTYMGSMNYI